MRFNSIIFASARFVILCAAATGCGLVPDADDFVDTDIAAETGSDVSASGSGGAEGSTGGG